MTDLFILGTSHKLQCGHESCSQSDVAAFHAELRRLCDEERIQRIAEEMSADGLAYYGVTETIGQRVSSELGLASNHQNVDLTIT